MRVTAAGLVADALRLFRRDRAILLAVAGPFWFLPSYAVALLIPAPPPPPADARATLAWIDAFGQWMAAQGPWYLVAWAIGLWGTATVYSLYLHRDRPAVGAALTHGARLWPRLLLTSAVIGMMAGAGLVLWVLPGLYVMGRLLPAGPALAAEPVSALGALGRGFRLSRGSGLALTAITAATLGMGWLVSQPFLVLGDWLRGGDGGNPVAIALVEAGAAAAAAAAGLASALLAVAAYRRLAR